MQIFLWRYKFSRGPICLCEPKIFLPFPPKIRPPIKVRPQFIDSPPYRLPPPPPPLRRVVGKLMPNDNPNDRAIRRIIGLQILPRMSSLFDGIRFLLETLLFLARNRSNLFWKIISRYILVKMLRFFLLRLQRRIFFFDPKGDIRNLFQGKL